jgi:hypothetical protein
MPISIIEPEDGTPTKEFFMKTTKFVLGQICKVEDGSTREVIGVYPEENMVVVKDASGEVSYRTNEGKLRGDNYLHSNIVTCYDLIA